MREFSDDSGPLPRKTCVHCVFCGAAIPLPRARVSAPPFSSEVVREAGSALGVLSVAGAGFPDTLRQFRIRQPALPQVMPRKADSLAPLADGDEAADVAFASPPAWHGVSFWASLGVGFGVGALLAYAAFVLRPSMASSTAAAASSAAPSRALATPLHVADASRRVTAPSAAAPSVATPSDAPTPSAAIPSVAPAKPATAFAARPGADPMQVRRFTLELARAEQRRYRLDGAERLYRQVLARAPEDSEALAGLGELELLRGTTDLARARFDQALAANSNYVPAQIAVADLEWQAGHVDAARQAYRDIVDHYGADLYPPYVAQRSSVGEPPQCDK